MNFPPSSAEEATDLAIRTTPLDGVNAFTTIDLGTHDVRRFNSYYFSVFGITQGTNDDPLYVQFSWFDGDNIPQSEPLYSEQHGFFLRGKGFYNNCFIQAPMHGPYLIAIMGALNGTTDGMTWRLLGSTRQLPNVYLGNDDDTVPNLAECGDDGFVVDSDSVSLAAGATRTYPFRHSIGPLQMYLTNGAGTLTYAVEVNRDGTWRQTGIVGTVAANTTARDSFYKTKEATRLSVTNTAGVASNVAARIYRSYTPY